MTGRDLVRRAFEAANKIGDLTCAACCGNQTITNLLIAGDPLAEAEREAEHGLAFAERARFGTVVDAIAAQYALIRTLRGLTPRFGCFDDQEFSEARIERRFSDNPDLAFVECLYWIRKLQARFLAGDYPLGLVASSRARGLLWTSISQLESSEYHLYAALSHAAACNSVASGERRERLDAIAAHQEQLRIWAANCLVFENRAALVAAEMARLEGRTIEAESLYEQAIRSARANAFIHQEALADELAARFYAARGFEDIADMYLRKARSCYRIWGADGKVRQLDELYPNFREERLAPGPASTIGAPVDHVDLATVIKVSQAVSGEIVEDKLIATLMRTAIEQAGAQRGLLVLQNGGEQRIAAEAMISGETVVRRGNEPVTSTEMPEAVLNYVLRSGEIVILDDAGTELPLGADPYIRQHGARSSLCLPLMNQADVTGALYLENSLTPHAFTSARVALLKLIASQAAVSLKNTLLYRDLALREARIRRLVDANIIGICISRPNGDILEANDAFLRIVRYDRAEFLAGPVSWMKFTASESVERTKLALEELTSTGAIQPFEKEYIRKDGSRVPVLVGVAGFDDERDLMVAFVLDLTERKRAEAEARESERRYRELQMEVAHANRAATMGQLTASIAHEVNQPIAATVTNAEAALRFLDRHPPDLEEVREGLLSILKDGNRAGNIIGRIRELIKKAPPRKEWVDINEAIHEVIELTRGEAVKSGASVQTALGEGLPLIEGDRVQLQQVALNVIMNAIQAMRADVEGPRELTITTAQTEPNGVLVAVKDTGPGLAPSSLEQLSAPFYTTKPDGLGMGLSICRSIIEAHRGRLWVTANLPQGAIFHFTVPTHAVSAS